ncbi:MAG: penicillin acylase family protein, partial [Halioglobus sp.]|nr:penicillin acylase family protein [Halioglobus sp.]
MSHSLFHTFDHPRLAPHKTLSAISLAFTLALAGCSDGSDTPAVGPEPPVPPAPLVDRAYYILPPGNFGGLPTNENSLDQLPLYDGLTPLRDNVTDADIERLFLPENFQPVGDTREEVTGRQGLTILYDSFGIAHVQGDTRADVAFGAGWVTARDRALLLELGRGPARAAVADVPGINAFGLVTSGQSFIPSAAAEQLVTDQIDLIIDTYGDEGREIIADAQAYADGINAYQAANGIDNPVPYNVNDVIAVTAFIGSIFGAGGGSEVQNAEFLSKLVNGIGEGQAQLAWEDAMLFNDPEAPTTISARFDYGPLTGGAVTGSAVIDEGSVVSLDPRDPIVAPTLADSSAVLVPAAGPPPDRQASNFLIVSAAQSVNGTNLAVMGPQLGYFYPEIVQQIHLSGPGIEAQGAAVPGLSMYILIGRTRDYAWSLTSANHDVRDVYAEMLCEPGDAEVTRDSLHYLYQGECIPFEIFDAGTLNGTPIRYPVSVHGPMIGTATSNGTPVALTRKRSTFGRDGLNLAGLKDMTEGDATTPERFWEAANKFGFTFNWG